MTPEEPVTLVSQPSCDAPPSSVIAADLIVSGTLTCKGQIRIDGRVEGDVRGTNLVVGENASIHGDVDAEDLTIRGRINGNIRARRVFLCSSCHVEGDILHEAFGVEAGAFFEGNCRHSANPTEEVAAARSSNGRQPSDDLPASLPSSMRMNGASAPLTAVKT